MSLQGWDIEDTSFNNFANALSFFLKMRDDNITLQKAQVKACNTTENILN